MDIGWKRCVEVDAPRTRARAAALHRVERVAAFARPRTRARGIDHKDMVFNANGEPHAARVANKEYFKSLNAQPGTLEPAYGLRKRKWMLPSELVNVEFLQCSASSSAAVQVSLGLCLTDVLGEFAVCSVPFGAATLEATGVALPLGILANTGVVRGGSDVIRQLHSIKCSLATYLTRIELFL